MLPMPVFAPFTASSTPDKTAAPAFTYRRATSSPADISGIQRVASVVDMTTSKSFTWPDEELIALIDTCDLLVVVVEGGDGVGIVGAGGISIYQEWSGTHYQLWTAECPCFVPNHGAGPYAVCRGLMVDPSHAMHGLGRSLHAARVRDAFEEGAQYLLLSARGVSLDGTQNILSSLKPSDTSDEILISCTYPSSHGVVRIARRFGMDFQGVDVDDGGPVWGQVMVHGCWEPSNINASSVASLRAPHNSQANLSLSLSAVGSECDTSSGGGLRILG